MWNDKVVKVLWNYLQAAYNFLTKDKMCVNSVFGNNIGLGTPRNIWSTVLGYTFFLALWKDLEKCQVALLRMFFHYLLKCTLLRMFFSNFLFVDELHTAQDGWCDTGSSIKFPTATTSRPVQSWSDFHHYSIIIKKLFEGWEKQQNVKKSNIQKVWLPLHQRWNTQCR